MSYDAYPIYGVQKLRNLNLAMIDNADGPDVPLRSDRGASISSAANIEVAFTDLDRKLCGLIKSYPVVVGCMAWLTNEGILKALATRDSVSVVVNKEDFLRPDRGNWSQQGIKALYKDIPGFDRCEIGRNYSCCGDPTGDAVRCAGIFADRSEVPPRMHHKFLVFCDLKNMKYDSSIGEWVVLDGPYVPDASRENYRKAIPRAVWTGSFNATFNATQSLENAVIITDDNIAQAYFDEWCDIIGISEPLDWRSKYVAPEWRYGT